MYFLSRDSSKAALQLISMISHNIILFTNVYFQEGDRIAVSKGIKDKENVAELFLQTVVHANNFLDSFDLLSFFFQVIGSKTYSFGHATYLSVLSCYILSIEIYRNNISGQQWQDLLSICIDCYQDQDSPVRKDKVLDAIQMIVLYGCSLSHLVFKIRKLLPFTGKKKHQKVIFNYLSLHFLKLLHPSTPA